ncbi:hypothetical protein [Vibrio phage JSF4]|nr:hypothetical protein TUST1-2_00555 [Vibrio phage ICP1_2001_A]APD17801.1 hypothetical protein [Vibrio phage JSF4]
MSWVKVEDFVDQVKNMEDRIISVSIDTRDIACFVTDANDVGSVDFRYHTNDILEVMYKTRNYEWCWVNNMSFRYVKLLMNTQTKMCCLMDRYGEVRTLDDLKHQHK